MPVVRLKQCIEKDENGEFHAVIKMGGYSTIEQAENMAQALMMILQDAMHMGMTITEKLPREIRKD